MRLAKERSGARIILEVNPETLTLARRSLDMLDGIVPRGQLPPAFDLHCELMSLPLALGLRLEDLPGPVPYLRPDETRVRALAQAAGGLAAAVGGAGLGWTADASQRRQPLAGSGQPCRLWRRLGAVLCPSRKGRRRRRPRRRRRAWR